MTTIVDPNPKSVFSGQLTVAASGTAAALPDVSCTRAVVRSLPGNLGAACYIGRGTTTGILNENTGLPLTADDPPTVLEGLRNLNELGLFVVANNDGVGFLALLDPLSNPLV